MMLLSFLSPLITNNKPLYCVVDGSSYFPAFNELFGAMEPMQIGNQILTANSNWQELEYESVLWPMLKNGVGNRDRSNKDFHSPFETSITESGEPAGWRNHHWLGTNRQGVDTLANLMGGIKYSLLIGISAVLIASFIGIILGALSGYYKNNYEIGKLQLICLVLSVLPAWFYGFSSRAYALSDAFENGPLIGTFNLILSLFIALGITLLFAFVGQLMDKRLGLKKTRFPLDNFITGLTEIFSSVPKIIIIVTVASLIPEKSTFILILILGVTGWPGIARITRGEVLRIRELSFVAAAKVSGLKDRTIITKHILKNAAPTLSVAIAFAIGGTILVESALSFLNIGVPDGTPTLGSILRNGRDHIEAWWLIVFPGITIFALIYLFNRIGDKIAQRRSS